MSRRPTARSYGPDTGSSAKLPALLPSLAAIKCIGQESPRRTGSLPNMSFHFFAHTPMEPLNTTVRFDGDRAEVWAGSQFQTVDQMAVAEVLGLKPDQVTFHTEMAGGGFGRRAVTDSHVQREAAVIAKRLRGTPVKLVWSREDDVQGGYYRPMHFHRVEIGVGADGLPAAWRHVIVGQSLLAGTPFEATWSRTASTRPQPKELLTRTTTFRTFTFQFIIRKLMCRCSGGVRSDIRTPRL